jgi:hypothetical protein
MDWRPGSNGRALPSKHKALSSNPSTTKGKKKQKELVAVEEKPKAGTALS